MADPVLVLASSSIYRASMLRQLGVTFSTESPNIDESPRAGEAPTTLAERLCVEKAFAINATGGCVIGCDQVASFNGEAMGKPNNLDDNVRQLSRVSGHTVSFETAVCVRNLDENTHEVRRTATSVRFRPLAHDEIVAYAHREHALDCTLGLKFEASAIQLVEAIASSDPTALTGLPLISLWSLLRGNGFGVRSAR